MENQLSLTEKFALLSLDGLESLHPSFIKKLTLRGIMAAQLLDATLNQKSLGSMDTNTLKGLLNTVSHRVKRATKKSLNRIETEITSHLQKNGMLEEIPNLLACDMNYYTSGVQLKSYRANCKLHLRFLECIRAEALEKGDLTEETFCMLWLFREICGIYDLFSSAEQVALNQNITDFCRIHDNYRLLWQTEFHKTTDFLLKSVLHSKDKIFKKPFMQGMNLIFPFLARQESIFIDMVVLNTSVGDRRMQVMNFLTENGHFVEDVTFGEETLLRIDNCYYRLFPSTRIVQLPIQGMVLLRIYQ